MSRASVGARSRSSRDVSISSPCREAVQARPAVHRGAAARALAGTSGDPDLRQGRFGPARSGGHNLVENAAKYTGPGGQITVTLEQRDDEAVLSVRDSGIGIAAENLERVFEPFTRHAMRSPAPERVGTGAERGAANPGTASWSHQGHQRRSRHGERICRHATGAGPANRQTPRPASPRKRRRPRRRAPRRVLIVDDHEEIRRSSRVSSASGVTRSPSPVTARAPSRWRRPSSRNAPSSTSHCRG